MPSWISSILLAGATTLFIGLVITPRLESRKPRIEARNNSLRVAYEARAELSKRVLTILSACGRLRNTPVEPSLAESRPLLAERLNAERQRWIEQLDDATRYLVDNMELFALGYATDRLRTIVGSFVTAARGIVLSERTIERKVERLTAITSPVQNLLFIRRWHMATIVQSFSEFERALATLEEDVPDDAATTPGPAAADPNA